MKTDIILCGVGGQGTLSIATIISEAATIAGLNMKQSEIHGMSQRGGSVACDLRLSDAEIWSDLISKGSADLILSMEPMEALRYVPYLSKKGVIVTSSIPYLNIPDYPSEQTLRDAMAMQGNVIPVDTESLAIEGGSSKFANIALLGAAARHIPIIKPDFIRQAITRLLSLKSEEMARQELGVFNKAYETV